ncbi:hypothetical protein B0T10DRAFT_581560 [Thelonectria olida]|uniref:Prion-inhibition and propagation HeLo domain-containing protein n=1 Tax=Thelonectria olida TaxID=1576542 RepID=A0A9P9AK46_9HYPO|nr:hypothetical protein B0T10DRAFT_581560 [Thelonectria olida]
MAEMFETVAGALGLAALLDQGVECFKYIQLGRHFARDFDWDEAVDINNARLTTEAPGDKEVQLARAILEKMSVLFQSMQNSSKRYELNASVEDLVCIQHQEPQSRAEADEVHQKTTWVLYDGQNFENLIDQFTNVTDELEKLFPAEKAKRRQIVETMIEDLFCEAIAEKVRLIGVKNHVQHIVSEDEAIVRLGNDWGNDAWSSGISVMDRTVKEAGYVFTKGSSVVYIRNRYAE